MVATAAAIVGALGAVASAGAGIAGMGANSRAQAASQKIQEEQLADARNNEQYQRMLSAMINQRSIAGTQDSFGSTMTYDPNTNTWTSKLGQLPFNAQTAADQAAIQRNTTDVRQAQLANEVAARRATQAGPEADRALRDMQSFKPMGQDELVGLLQRQATNASNASFDPLRSDMLRSFQRSGTAAGPVLASLGKQQADTLRESLIDAQIKGMTNVDQINQSKQQALAQNAGNAATLAQPQFQYAGINPSDKSATMAQAIAARSQQAGIAPAYGMGGVNTAVGDAQKAAGAAAAAVPGDTHPGVEAAKSIGSVLRDKDLQSNLTTAYNGIFNPVPPQSQWEQELQNSPQSVYYNDPTGTRSFGTPEEGK